MDSRKVWVTTDDGEIDIISLTKEFIPGVLELLHNSVYSDEAACIAAGVAGNEESMAELDLFNLTTAKDGLSVIAVQKATNKVVGVLFNKVQVKNDLESEEHTTHFLKQCKNRSTFAIFDIVNYANSQCNMYEHCNVDSLMELEYLGTQPEFRKRGIATKLCQASEIIGQKLLQGENVRTSLDGSVLPLEPVPKILISTFSSPYSKAIGNSLNWEICSIVTFDSFLTDGNKLLKPPPPMNLVCKRLSA